MNRNLKSRMLESTRGLAVRPENRESAGGLTSGPTRLVGLKPGVGSSTEGCSALQGSPPSSTTPATAPGCDADSMGFRETLGNAHLCSAENPRWNLGFSETL